MIRPLITKAFRRFSPQVALFAVLAMTLLLPATVISAPLASVFVNGVRIDSYPIVKEGVSYLPIQVMAQALKAEITWDSKLNLVKVNGEASSATVLNKDGRIYLPIEAFVTAMGGNVAYDGRQNVIRIQTDGSVPSSASVPSGQSGSASVQPRNTVTIPPVTPSTPSTSATIPIGSGQTGTSVQGKYDNGSGTATGTTGYGNSGSTTGYGSGTTGYGNGNTFNGAYSSSSPGFPSSYSSANVKADTTVRPIDAPPYLGDNLTPGPSVGLKSDRGTSTGYAPLPANAQRPVDGGVYVPRSAQNSIFQVTVTNLETLSVIKDFYRPRTGYKFVVAYLSQQNVSEQVQIYTGRFSLMDQKGTSYEYIEGLSNFWLVILRPFGVNFGYLVFEVPVDAKPISLVLHALNQAPLTVSLL
ncbi:MAG: hypothetical protein K6G50_08275 [bacterium]|nr:hypothetical protein [bacterium]